jgi:hypothetical protein
VFAPLVVFLLSFGLAKFVRRLCAELAKDRAGVCLIVAFVILGVITQSARRVPSSVHVDAAKSSTERRFP